MKNVRSRGVGMRDIVSCQGLGTLLRPYLFFRLSVYLNSSWNTYTMYCQFISIYGIQQIRAAQATASKTTLRNKKQYQRISHALCSHVLAKTITVVASLYQCLDDCLSMLVLATTWYHRVPHGTTSDHQGFCVTKVSVQRPWACEGTILPYYVSPGGFRTVSTMKKNAKKLST